MQGEDGEQALHPGVVTCRELPYGEGWALQQQYATARLHGEIPDTFLVVEHLPVYTVGRNGEESHLPHGRIFLENLGADVVSWLLGQRKHNMQYRWPQGCAHTQSHPPVMDQMP